ncbi:MAG: DNA glycosylase AlkZ-like family protein [Chloroflexota bacterium]
MRSAFSKRWTFSPANGRFSRNSILLSHRQRERLAAAKHQPKIHRPQGWVSPVVLVDGRAAAVWTHTRQGDRLAVHVSQFDSLPQRIRAGIREEARFLVSPNVDVQVD